MLQSAKDTNIEYSTCARGEIKEEYEGSNKGCIRVAEDVENDRNNRTRSFEKATCLE